MLLAVDSGANPTQKLVAAIQRRGGTGLSKEEDFHLAFLAEVSARRVGGTDVQNGEIGRLVKILSGDPSRGALSLDTAASLRVGERVQVS